MPKDQRLYMTFPIEMPEHPKIKPLSDSAFRVFVEINAYSRRLGLDGRIPVKAAQATWKRKPLSELEANHPDKPTLTVDGDVYVIRDYAEHQLTTSAIDDLREKRAESGRKGGKATASAQASAAANGEQAGSKVLAESESESESESRSESLTDMTYDPLSSHLPSSEGSGSDGVSSSIQLRARAAGVEDIEKTRALLEKTAGQDVSYAGALMLVEAITSKSKNHIKRVDAYVAVACRKSPIEIQDAYFQLDIGGVP